MTSQVRSGADTRGSTRLGISSGAHLWAVVILHGMAAVVVILEVVRPFAGGAHAVERVVALDFTGSYALYGFVACVVLVLLGRLLRLLLMRTENYYDGDA